jgi:hypothetical protein
MRIDIRKLKEGNWGQIGQNDDERRAAYRALFTTQLGEKVIKRTREATNGTSRSEMSDSRTSGADAEAPGPAGEAGQT